MLTFKKESNGLIFEIRGLSTDEKPMSGDSATNGTIFVEMDTGKVFMFDKENVRWREL